MARRVGERVRYVMRREPTSHGSTPLHRPFPSAASPAEVQRASDAMVSNCSPTHSTPLHVLRPPKTNAARATSMSMSLSLSHETRGRACELQHRNGRGPRARASSSVRPISIVYLRLHYLTEPAAPEEAFLPSFLSHSQPSASHTCRLPRIDAGGRAVMRPPSVAPT